MQKRFSILLVLLAALAPALAKEFAPLTIASGLAEQYTVCRWSMEDGLPENDLRALCFSADGFLWCVGTHSVTRFDGTRFSTQTKLPQKGGWQGVIAKGTHGLWAYGASGAYRPADGIQDAFWPESRKGAEAAILWMQGTGSNVTWAASSKALWELKDRELREYRLPRSTPTEENISAVAADNTGCFWVAAGQRILRFEQGAFAEEKLPPDCAVDFQHLAVAHDGTLWAASGESLYCRRQGRWEAVPVPEVARGRRLGILCLYAAPDGALWVGTESTLYQVRFGLWPEALQYAQTPIRRVQWIGAAPDGSLWLAGGDGLRQLRRRSIRTFRTEEPLHRLPITALAADVQGRLLAGVANLGLLQTQPVGDLAPCPLQGLPERLPITALAADRDGSLWVGNQGDYLWHWHDEVADPFLGANINALLIDHTGRLLIGMNEGLKYFDAHRDEVVDFTNATGRVTGRVNALLADRTGRVWIGTQFDGLLQLATNGVPVRCGVAATILALHEDSEGIVWVGTPAGLECWHGAQHVTLLPDEYVAQILDDNSGNLWLGLRRGLARISKAELREAAQNPKARLYLRFFGVSEGFPDAPCASGSGHLALKTADGKLWFATQDGLAMVDPWRVAEPPAESLRVYLDEVRPLGGAWYPPGLGPTVSVGIDVPGVHGFDFQFTVPCFTEPEAVRFSWRLDGFDGAWTAPSPEGHALYPQLPPGTYRFQVRAVLNGTWSQPAWAQVTVAPLFWQTWWWLALVYAAGAAAVALVALALYRWRVRREQQLDRLRLRIARDLHDEIGSNLGGIALLIGVAEHDPDAFQRIRAITLQSIEALKDLVWMIDPGHDALPDMLQRMRGIAEDLLPGKLRAFTVTGDPAGRRASLEVRRNVLPIFKEALHNIIKHARAQHVTVGIILGERRLTLTIRDDGVGMDPAAAPGGHGLRNMQRRAEDIGGQLTIESQPGAGTVIHLEAPLA